VLRVAHKTESGGRGEDRVHVEQCGSQTVAIVADGAGGMGGGAVAAEMACSLAAQAMRKGAGSAEAWAQCLLEIDRALERGGSGGQCTAVVVEVSDNCIIGSSVGDSGAWLLTGRSILDLTEAQHRNPLLGSGEALPVGFGPIELSGRLLIASDGLFKYATRQDIVQRAIGVSLSDAVERLIAGLRLRSGALQDDVGIILLERVDGGEIG
jgi:serine/threonine protein phosphatase PrpC